MNGTEFYNLVINEMEHNDELMAIAATPEGQKLLHYFHGAVVYQFDKLREQKEQ